MGSTETTTVETAPLSAEGKEWMAMFKGMYQASLDEAGWDVSSTEVTEYKDPDKASKLEGDISGVDQKLADIDRRISDISAKRDQGFRGFGEQELRNLQGQRQNLETQKTSYQKQLDKIGKDTYQKFDVKKREDVRVVDAIAKYGEDSAEVRAARAAVKQEEVYKAESLAGIEQDYLKNMKKFVSGDYSYTPEQARQAEIYTKPVKDIIVSSADSLLKMAGDNADVLKTGLNDLLSEIDKTGFDVLDALKAAEIQVDKSGVTMLDALKAANASSLNRARFQFDLLSEEIDKKAAQTSAFLGLPPGSMAEQMQKAKMKNDALRSLELEAAERDSQGALGISQLTEEGKQRISLSRVALAESQGGKKEDVGRMRLSIDENLGTTKMSVAQARANALLGLEGQKQEMLQSMAFGNVPSILGIAQGGLGFDNQQKQQNQAFNFQTMAPATQQLGVEQQRQFAETTTTTKKSPGFLDVFSDIIGAGAAAAGAVTSGIGAMQAPKTFNFGA